MRTVWFGLLVAGVLGAQSPGFRAAVVKVDITPETPKWLLGYAPRQSTGVHDRIYHRVVAMDDGRQPFVLISTDLCIFSPALYDELAARVGKANGLDPKAVWWTVTHTHSAPEVGSRGIYPALLKGRSDHEVDPAYTAEVVDKLVEAVRQARARLEPARISIGTGIAWANINRRARDVDGRISLGLNPERPVDRQIGLIRLERANGAPLALIANYAIHGTVLGGQCTLISGDAPGVAADHVEQNWGAPVLFVNGAAGNIAPIYSVYPNPKAGHLSEFKVLLGERILAANQALGPSTAAVSLWVGEKIVETPRKADLDWPQELAAYHRTGASGAHRVRLPLRFLRINDMVAWGGPIEMFCEIAMNVRRESPFAHTFFFGYTNGWLGYLPTRAGFAEGGYEPATSPFTGQGEADVTEAVTAYLQGIPRAR